MNDATPRKFSGSLLERAAEVYPFGLEPRIGRTPVEEAAPVAEPEPEVEPVADLDAMLAEPPIEPGPRPLTFDEVSDDDAVEEPWLASSDDDERLSLFARLGTVFTRFRRSPRRDVDDFVEVQPDEVPEEPFADNGAVSRARLARKGLLTPGGAVTVLAEEFRMVKRQLLTTSRLVAATDPAAARMILVCSAQPGDGKTFCAVNLALSLAAERDTEVLLVDADFAKPDVLNTIGLQGGKGLLDALADSQIDVEDCIIRTDIPQLSVLPSGAKRSTDTELLASAHARTLLDGLAAANPDRIVVFDSPPALAASPAAVLASHVGQVMLIVRADRTTESDLRETVQLLEGCEHIQLLLNAQSLNPGGRRFGAYYGEGAAA